MILDFKKHNMLLSTVYLGYQKSNAEFKLGQGQIKQEGSYSVVPVSCLSRAVVS